MTKSWRSLVFCAVACVSVVGIENASTQSPGTEGSSTSPVTQLQCDMQGYKPATGLNAVLQGNSLAVSWTGQDGAELRARYGVDGGTPVVRELAVRKQGGQWVSLGENLRPEYHVVSGIRRFSGQQGQPLTGLGQLTPERMEKEKWFVYRDAPLYIRWPNTTGRPGRTWRWSWDGRRRRSSRGPWRTWRRWANRRRTEAGRHSPRKLVVQDDVLQRQDRWGSARGEVQRSVDGHL